MGKLCAVTTQPGLVGVQIKSQGESRQFIPEWAPGMGVEEFAVSAIIEVAKPI